LCVNVLPTPADLGLARAHVTGLASSDAPGVTVTLYRISVLSPAWGDVD